MTSLKIYLQQSQRCQEFSHKDISAQETSYTCRCTRPLVQRYKAKHALRQNSTKLIKLFDFLFFMLLGSKTLGTNVLELQFVLCWQTMIKTQSIGLDLPKVCLFVKLKSSDCRTYWTKSARLDRSKIRLDRLNHVQIYFSVEFQFNPNST